MQSSNLPSRIPIPFASSAGSGFIRPIPQTSQIGISDGAASYPDGFPPLNFLPTGAGGVPPYGQDMNRLGFDITSWIRWGNSGGAIPYDATYADAIGGYPRGAILSAISLNGAFWLSTVENNTSNPDTGGAGWTALIFPQAPSTSSSAQFNLTPSPYQSLANNVTTTVQISGSNPPWGALATNIVTINASGFYGFTLQGQMTAGNASGSTIEQIAFNMGLSCSRSGVGTNGSAVAYSYAGGGSLTSAFIAYLAAGDTVNVVAKGDLTLNDPGYVRVTGAIVYAVKLV